nr:superoxide dismutase [Cu-Zn] SodC [uncultured Rhodopila sp.]
MRLRTGYILSAILLAAFAGPARAADTVVTIHKATPEGTGDSLGTIAIADSAAGATFKLDLHGLPPGPHGFHVHENGSCDPAVSGGNHVAAGAAGGHMDPDHTGKHAGPDGQGHLGDLPVLDVAADGTATQTLTAPHIKSAAALKGHALMIHAGGDNYSDTPAPLGGGGGRFGCGVVQ